MFARTLAAIVFCLSFTYGGGIAVAQSVSVNVPPPPETVSPQRRADISRLLSLLKVVEGEVKSLEPIFEHFKRSVPNVPAKVWEDLKKEFDAEFTAEMILNTYVPIYARRFSAAEVKELIKFFETPAGKKMVETMPLIREEAYMVGFERGQKIGQRLQERLRAKGYAPPET